MGFLKTLNILYVVHGYKPAYRIGGPVHSVSGAAEALVRKGHRVTVFTTNSNLDRDLEVALEMPVEIEGVTVFYFRRMPLARVMFPWISYLSKSLGYLYCPNLAEAFDKNVPGFDLVHTHLPFIYPTYAAWRSALKWGKPLFYHQRGVFDPERLRFRGVKKKLYLRLVERKILRQATTLIALTEFERESFVGLAPNTPCRVVPNGVDPGLYEGASAEAANARWGIPADAMVVLFLGRLHPIKGADILLQAFLKILPEVPNAVLILAGPDEWRIESALRETSHGRSGVVPVLFPGMVEGVEKANLLARADLFCLPSSGEGFSMAALEALASSTPVLLSPGCHFPECEKAGAGAICEPTPESLAASMVRLLADPVKLQSMGEAGRALVRDRYDWDQIAEALLDVYREGIERHSGQKGNDDPL